MFVYISIYISVYLDIDWVNPPGCQFTKEESN